MLEIGQRTTNTFTFEELKATDFHVDLFIDLSPEDIPASSGSVTGSSPVVVPRQWGALDGTRVAYRDVLAVVLYTGKFGSALDDAVDRLEGEGIEPAWGDLYCIIGFDEANNAGLTQTAAVAAYFRLGDMDGAVALATYLGLSSDAIVRAYPGCAD